MTAWTRQLSVKTTTGGYITFAFCPSDTTQSLKLQVEESEGPIYGQSLIFGGKQIEDGRTLADYNIQSGSELYLVHGMRGGMTSDVEMDAKKKPRTSSVRGRFFG